MFTGVQHVFVRNFLVGLWDFLLNGLKYIFTIKRKAVVLRIHGYIYKILLIKCYLK